MVGEEDLKGLEEEIDDAVERLFVEKKRGEAETFLMESPVLEPSLKSPALEPTLKPPVLEPSLQSPILEPSLQSPISEPPMKSSLLEASFEDEKDIDLESPLRPPPVPIPFLKSIEKMEAQLLSLEWEITEEKLKKTREEVLALRELLKQKADITSILSDMEKVLNHMIKNEEDIRPPWIKFLLDSKETIKLLMRKETDSEINIYKQLAYLGIEARFSCLEGMKETPMAPPSFIPAGEIKKTEIPIMGGAKIEETLSKMDIFSEKMDEILKKMDPCLSKIGQMTLISSTFGEPRSLPVNITIFKVDEKLFGVESEKVFKLFKVPSTFQKRYSNQQKIRLRDFEVKMINLKKIFSIPGGERKEEIKILTVKANGEYKGFMVDQVLKKLSATSDRGEEHSEYFSGVIHFTYQEKPVEIPILDLKKL